MGIGRGGRWQDGARSYGEESARKRKAGLMGNHRCQGRQPFSSTIYNSQAEMNADDHSYHLSNISSVLSVCI